MKWMIQASLSVPGPRGSLSYPLELAVKLGFDKSEGINLRLKFVGGGGVAIQDLDLGNADFGVLGLPAAMLANVGMPPRLVALAAIDDLPLYTMMVRQDLKAKVKRIEDLKGMRIGIFSNALATKTTSQQVAELVLKNHGISETDVVLIAVGHSWETQSAAFISRSIDASMCDEPFGFRLAAEKLAFELFSTGNPRDAVQITGSGFLRGSLIARRQQVDANPISVGRMVSVIKRALSWIQTHSPEEFADTLGMIDGERASFVAVAKKYPRQYSSDGRFSTRQLRETGVFFKASNANNPDAQRLQLDGMVNNRWAGSKP